MTPSERAKAIVGCAHVLPFTAVNTWACEACIVESRLRRLEEH